MHWRALCCGVEASAHRPREIGGQQQLSKKTGAACKAAMGAFVRRLIVLCLTHSSHRWENPHFKLTGPHAAVLIVGRADVRPQQAANPLQRNPNSRHHIPC
jgi:hypothetical protein